MTSRLTWATAIGSIVVSVVAPMFMFVAAVLTRVGVSAEANGRLTAFLELPHGGLQPCDGNGFRRSVTGIEVDRRNFLGQPGIITLCNDSRH